MKREDLKVGMHIIHEHNKDVGNCAIVTAIGETNYLYRFFDVNLGTYSEERFGEASLLSKYSEYKKPQKVKLYRYTFINECNKNYWQTEWTTSKWVEKKYTSQVLVKTEEKEVEL